jgi:hypothetical protein
MGQRDDAINTYGQFVKSRDGEAGVAAPPEHLLIGSISYLDSACSSASGGPQARWELFRLLGTADGLKSAEFASLYGQLAFCVDLLGVC